MTSTFKSKHGRSDIGVYSSAQLTLCNLVEMLATGDIDDIDSVRTYTQFSFLCKHACAVHTHVLRTLVFGPILVAFDVKSSHPGCLYNAVVHQVAVVHTMSSQ